MRGNGAQRKNRKKTRSEGKREILDPALLYSLAAASQSSRFSHRGNVTFKATSQGKYGRKWEKKVEHTEGRIRNPYSKLHRWDIVCTIPSRASRIVCYHLFLRLHVCFRASMLVIWKAISNFCSHRWCASSINNRRKNPRNFIRRAASIIIK